VYIPIQPAVLKLIQSGLLVFLCVACQITSNISGKHSVIRENHYWTQSLSTSKPHMEGREDLPNFAQD